MNNFSEEATDASFFSSNFADLGDKKFCRTCLVLCDTFSIDTIKFDNVKLRIILKKYANIEVNLKSKLPHTMCKICIRKMYSTHNFLTQCHNSEKLLKSVENETNDETDFIDNVFQNDEYASDTSDNIFDLEKMTVDTGTENDSKKSQFKEAKIKEPLYHTSSDPQCLDEYKVKWPDPPPYVCKTCNKYFNTHKKLLIHKKETKHNRGYNYMCPHCKKRFLSPSVLLPHLRGHTKEKPLQCSICPKKFRERSVLLRHVRTHSDIKPYVCQQCGNSYTRSAYLRDHIRIHEGLICKFCGEGFNSAHALTAHERCHLKKSMRLHSFYNRSFRSEGKKQQFTCEICGKILSAKRALEEHLAEHGPKTMSCDHCDKKFATELKKLTHMKNVHLEKEGNAYICYHCGKSYNKYVLKDHLRTHSEDAYCKVCDKNFTLMSSYEMHMRLHNGNADTLCKVCNRFYTSKRSLKVHMLSHGEWQFSCEKCNKKFFDEKSSRRHSINCTGTKGA